jgi:hypothetical protein
MAHSVLLCLLILMPPSLVASELKTLYFYNPEVSATRNTVLKGSFDKYLLSEGEFQLQPVEEKRLFDQLLFSGRADALLMSSQHFEQLVADNPELNKRYHAALQGKKGDSDSYTKLLVSKFSAPDLKVSTLASSRGRDFSLAMIAEMLPSVATKSIEQVSLLEVPKDIDALMSVGFDLADLALATDDSFATLSALYNEQYPKLHVIGRSRPLKRMILVLPRHRQGELSAIETTVRSMPEKSLGKRVMKLIGLDSWQVISDKNKYMRHGGQK